MRRSWLLVVFLVVFLVVLLVGGCRAEPSLPAAPDIVESDAFSIEGAAVVEGVRDRERDPFVLALDIGGDAPCAAILLAGDLLLTARQCTSHVTSTIDCGSKEPQILSERLAASLAVYAGDEGRALMARGDDIASPEGDTLCNADVAVLWTDRVLEGIVPRPVRKRAVTVGEHVRTVGFVAGVRTVREHVEVAQVGRAEFRVAESVCRSAPGSAAIDEATGELVGILSRSAVPCEADPRDAANLYTRLDVYAGLLEGAKATAQGNVKPQKSKPPTDVGTGCRTSADCATGVCVRQHDSGYCSRFCGASDRCPTQYHCTEGRGGQRACAGP